MASVRAVDHSIPPGVESNVGEGDEWPGIRAQILDSEILVLATPSRDPALAQVCKEASGSSGRTAP
jgi:hypothetical protein